MDPKKTLEFLDDLIDLWHESDKNVPLYEFLGLSKKEYKDLIHRPLAMGKLVIKRNRLNNVGN